MNQSSTINAWASSAMPKSLFKNNASRNDNFDQNQENSAQMRSITKVSGNLDVMNNQAAQIMINQATEDELFRHDTAQTDNKNYNNFQENNFFKDVTKVGMSFEMVNSVFTLDRRKSQQNKSTN